MSEQTIFLAALSYARLGLSVMPVAADCRRPLLAHGVHEASDNEGEIGAWWQRWPNANIGLACGPRSGLLVLDVDCKSADGYDSLDELEAQFGPLPRSWRARTPSGGAHIYLAHPRDRSPRNKVGFRPGLDIRAAGGSVTAPPSLRRDGCYRWSVSPRQAALASPPAWLLEVIDPPAPARAQAAPRDGQSMDQIARYAAKALHSECGQVADAPEGARNSSLFRAACCLGELVAGGILPRDLAEARLQEAAVANGLVSDDGLAAVTSTIASGFSHGSQRPRGM